MYKIKVVSELGLIVRHRTPLLTPLDLALSKSIDNINAEFAFFAKDEIRAWPEQSQSSPEIETCWLYSWNTTNLD